MNRPVQQYYEFDQYRLGQTERLLTRSGEIVPLPPKALELLIALVENHSHLVTKQELIERIWPDSFVEEANLSRNIFLLRKVFNGDGKSFIETYPRRGYRFTADVHEISEAALAEAAPASSAIDTSEDAAAGNLTPVTVAMPAFGQFRIGAWRYSNMTVSVLILVLAAGMFVGWTVFLSKTKHLGSRNERTFQLVTNSGRAGNASISPDGKFIAYAENYQRGDGTIFVLQPDTNREIKLLDNGERVFSGTAFSHDGAFIYYVAYDKQDPAGALHRIPVLGGTSTRLLGNIGSMFSLSPDDARVAFYRKDVALKQESLIIANLDGSGEETILTRPYNEMLFSGIAAWSPDGDRIAFAADFDRTPEKSYADVRLYTIEIDSRQITPLSNETWRSIGKMNWLVDRGGLIYVASAPRVGLQVYFLDLVSGESRRVTEGLLTFGNYSLGVTDDGRALVAGSYIENANLWSINSSGDTAGAVQISKGGNDGNLGLVSLTGGRIAYVRGLGDTYDIWTVNDDGTALTPITTGPYWHSGLTATADGQFLIFASDRGGGEHLFRMRLDGTDIRQLTFGNHSDRAPDASPDGQWVVYQSWIDHKSKLRKVRIEGGESTELTDYDAVQPTFSPDGNWIACVIPSNSPAINATLAVLPAVGGVPQKTFHIIPFGWYYQSPRWTPDGSALVFHREADQTGNLWKQDLIGGEPQQITNFKSDKIWNYIYSNDNSRIYITRGQTNFNIVLIKNFLSDR